ncbi:MULTISPECIES: hypothetical protein [unclassified Aurantimonas]|uniref:hypothetical protein n=1 Tax=unclassified Aurantimonas TaxID=2638230 RepID=UPI002E18D48C|nr:MULTISPECIES: hypothetical protein [unclassified Aurantimonas]MEC5289412.1 hypothetical protein [Aurantimonas sp. C2-3-R2]MEC5410492.1 hypothetical protein [Aurantimonas sp. C2-4-R8]
MNDNAPARWKATIIYRTENGPVDVEHTFEEIEALHGIIERGPHWDAIVRCTVVLNRQVESRTMTVEEAARL